MAVLLPLSISPHPSRSLGLSALLVHGVSTLAVLLCQLPISVKAAVCLALSLSLVTVFRSQMIRSGKRAIVVLTLRNLPEIEVAFRDGTRETARIDKSSTVLPQLVALRLKVGRLTRPVLLLPDMIPEESWRALSILLRTLNTDQQSAATKR